MSSFAKYGLSQQCADACSRLSVTTSHGFTDHCFGVIVPPLLEGKPEASQIVV